MSNPIAYKNAYTLGIALTLGITPVLYYGFLTVFLRGQFSDEASGTMFLLYNIPFWVLLMFIIGVELFRRAITRQFTKIAPIYMVMIGSIFIAIIGIVICPVGPKLLSSGTLVFIATNLLLGTIAGLIIDRLFVKACKNGRRNSG